jgi:hypothetical protein
MIDELIVKQTVPFRQLHKTDEELIQLVKKHQVNTALYALKMGQALKELKATKKNWRGFVEANFTFKVRTADRLIQGFNNALDGGFIVIKEDIEVQKPLPTATTLRNMHKPLLDKKEQTAKLVTETNLVDSELESKGDKLGVWFIDDTWIKTQEDLDEAHSILDDHIKEHDRIIGIMAVIVQMDAIEELDEFSKRPLLDLLYDVYIAGCPVYINEDYLKVLVDRLERSTDYRDSLIRAWEDMNDEING